MNDRAIVYRRKYGIPSEWGTAVNVQAMVYGNTGDKSGSGVAFTRDPATGEKVFYGEFLINAQGEDVVAGVRTPEPVLQLKNHLPHAFNELDPGIAFQRRAGFRVHDSGGKTVHAPDAQRQADRARGGAVCH
jgi:phosphoenolpyruvate synthase/pyruvate phosphate dikinase